MAWLGFFPLLLCHNWESNSRWLRCTSLRDLNSGRFSIWGTATHFTCIESWTHDLPIHFILLLSGLSTPHYGCLPTSRAHTFLLLVLWVPSYHHSQLWQPVNCPKASVSRKSIPFQIRFVAVSATIPNAQDIAEWLGKKWETVFRTSFSLKSYYIPFVKRWLWVMLTFLLRHCWKFLPQA